MVKFSEVKKPLGFYCKSGITIKRCIVLKGRRRIQGYS